MYDSSSSGIPGYFLISIRMRFYLMSRKRIYSGFTRFFGNYLPTTAEQVIGLSAVRADQTIFYAVFGYYLNARFRISRKRE
jgi:hypothetical protein